MKNNENLHCAKKLSEVKFGRVSYSTHFGVFFFFSFFYYRKQPLVKQKTNTDGNHVYKRVKAYIPT